MTSPTNHILNHCFGATAAPERSQGTTHLLCHKHIINVKSIMSACISLKDCQCHCRLISIALMHVVAAVIH